MESVVQLCKLQLECLIARTQDAASATMATERGKESGRKSVSKKKKQKLVEC